MESILSFHRHPRPQKALAGSSRRDQLVTVKSKIPPPQELLKSGVAGGELQTPKQRRRAPISAHDLDWCRYRKLGMLLQGNGRYIVAQDDNRLFMFREAPEEGMVTTAQRLNHPNVLTMQRMVKTGEKTYLGYQYTRFTLEEILTTHVPLDAHQVRLIAKSVSRTVKVWHFSSYSRSSKPLPTCSMKDCHTAR